MKHTFLFEEGTWIAVGAFTDAEGNAAPVRGQSKTIHGPDVWVEESYLELQTDDRIEIRNNYRIVPFEKGSDTTTWTSLNPTLGKLSGKFAVVDDSIISSFKSENLVYTGLEFLKKVDDDKYINRGVLLKDGEKFSSWAVELTREKQTKKRITSDE